MCGVCVRAVCGVCVCVRAVCVCVCVCAVCVCVCGVCVCVCVCVCAVCVCVFLLEFYYNLCSSVTLCCYVTNLQSNSIAMVLHIESHYNLG